MFIHDFIFFSSLFRESRSHRRRIRTWKLTQNSLCHWMLRLVILIYIYVYFRLPAWGIQWTWVKSPPPPPPPPAQGWVKFTFFFFGALWGCLRVDIVKKSRRLTTFAEGANNKVLVIFRRSSHKITNSLVHLSGAFRDPFRGGGGARGRIFGA